jgi:hypothetical protein
MNLQEIVDKVRASEIPVGALAAAGIVVGVVALKAGKVTSRLLFSVIAVALFCGAVWWHMQRR